MVQLSPVMQLFVTIENSLKGKMTGKPSQNRALPHLRRPSSGESQKCQQDRNKHDVKSRNRSVWKLQRHHEWRLSGSQWACWGNCRGICKLVENKRQLPRHNHEPWGPLQPERRQGYGEVKSDNRRAVWILKAITPHNSPLSLNITATYAHYWCSKLTDPKGVFSSCHSLISPDHYKEVCLWT